MGGHYLLVFIGGGLGSICRYAIGRWLGAAGLFPWGTFVANLLACLLLGALIALTTRGWLAPSLRPLLIAGFCGGFSTFSTFSNEMLQLLRQEQWGWAGLYVAASLLGGLLAVAVGLKLAALR